MPKLTEQMIQKAKSPTDGQRFLRDSHPKGHGLALRLTSGGSRTWVWEGRVKGRVRRITLGPYPALSLPQARQRSLEMAAAVASGSDPAAAIAQERGELTLGKLSELYIERHAKPHKRSVNEDERMLRDVLPDDGKEHDPAPIPSTWKNRRLSDISSDDVAELHARLQRDRGPYAANRVLALLRAILNLAKTWGLFHGDNPTLGIRMFREEKRERFLSPEELKRVITEIAKEPDWRWRAYFMLAPLLGSRKGELLQARWENVDLSARVWLMPTTKAGRSHLLPLPTPALKILESLPSRGKSEWLFPSPTSQSGHLEEPKMAWQRIRARAGVKDVRIHDLRRTLGSWLAANGYSLPLIGRVLNHSQPSVTAVYARFGLEPVRQAMEATSKLMLKAR